jgi:hypothetical protein
MLRDVRLWSLHPKYLDPAGLVALWREGLLAQAVLSGQTRGYTHHPQLMRFRAQDQPREAIAGYLHCIADEADRRGYRFDRSRIRLPSEASLLVVTEGQLLYEWQHLKRKLRVRSPARYRRLLRERTPSPHPRFVVVAGGIAEWEKRS